MSNPADRQTPPAPTPPKHRRYVRNYLIDKGLQLRYLAAVVIISGLIAGALGFLLNRQETYASSQIVASMNDPTVVEFLGDEGVAAVKGQLLSQDQSQLAIMVIVAVGLMVVLSGYLILMTHKVAGPLFKIGAYFDRMRDGKLPKVYDLRKGDQLVDFFEKFKQMDEALRERTEHEILVFEKLAAACESAGVKKEGEFGHHLDELKALVKEKRESLS